ncbi:ABC transporter [Achromobacter xylosoxidans]|jgi:phospholipid transport system substrate-binding protein|uniref:Intermembrane phospholipid transport system binding protein MlaC n=2 Tax=Achromobacter TaxID=222 RepID=A0A1D8I3P6_9BURK|nr:ABC transporter substrate-binding protein [Achromobacter ruhlandii]AKP87742.1 putative ABC transporter, auxiliary component YrbC [Achromobacter xylosoxidans]ALX81896.1 ABC transporter [Achromobacter denitrificans]AMG44081.1 ABC transporter [Achromobacter xylosoxidans]AOU91087.1 ABC transporter periplasmic binding protein MlaC [Achromobacter ruhlandii]MCI1835746.1 ABC transporter substrate-binding protein [Achromobacter ruhlandii]
MRFSFFPLLQRLAFAGLLGLAATPAVQAQPNANGTPNEFVLAAANEALDVLKADGAVKAGNTARINQVVNEHILPYVNFQKTTRLAAGRYWRQATEQQKTALADAFRGTLVRTYSGALTRVTSGTTITALPFRGDPKADDAVVRTLISQPNGQPVGVDYRLEKTPQGWKIYDMNVEGIWLIENYRNQFAQQINQNGIDGLIQALNQRNK